MNPEDGQPVEPLEPAASIETQDPEPQPQPLSLDDMERALKAAGRFPEPPAPARSDEPRQEFIEGTRIVKPEGYDLMSFEQSQAYIAMQTTMMGMQMQHAASRNARAIETSADDWYRPYLERVIADTNPEYLAQATTKEMQDGLKRLAMGYAIEDGRTPQKPGAPVPPSSPSGVKPQTSVVSSEVDQVPQGIRDAGYERVAASPKIRELLSQ